MCYYLKEYIKSHGLCCRATSGMQSWQGLSSFQEWPVQVPLMGLALIAGSTLRLGNIDLVMKSGRPFGVVQVC